MEYAISYACFTGKGRVRQSNQDNYYCCGAFLPELHDTGIVPAGRAYAQDAPLFFIFDGMGGEDRGETASYLCAQTVKEAAAERSDKDDPDLFLHRLCLRMNARLTAEADALGCETVGSTAAGILFEPERVTVCNLGDSRVYRLREDAFTLCSRDHTVPLPEGRSNALVQFLGVRESEFSVSPHLAHAAPAEGDLFLICSDGLTDMLPPQRIGAILRANPTPFSAAALLYNEALRLGGRDNVTVIVCRIGAR